MLCVVSSSSLPVFDLFGLGWVEGGEREMRELTSEHKKQSACFEGEQRKENAEHRGSCHRGRGERSQESMGRKLLMQRSSEG